MDIIVRSMSTTANDRLFYRRIPFVCCRKEISQFMYVRGAFDCI